MSTIPNQNGNFTVKKNDVIFLEGQNVNSLNILLQGKLDVLISPFDEPKGMPEEEILKKSFKIFSISHNLFLGPNDLCTTGNYSFTFKAQEDTSMYAFLTESMEQLKGILDAQKDYSACIITTNGALIDHAYAALVKLKKFIRTLTILTDNLVAFYWALREEFGFASSPSSRFFRDGLENLQKLRDENITVPGRFSTEFLEKDHCSIFYEDLSFEPRTNTEKAEYYRRTAGLPAELRKNFFAEDFFITSYQCKDSASCLNDIRGDLKEGFLQAAEIFKRLYSDDGESIFGEYARASGEIGSGSQDPAELLKTLDYIVAKIRAIIALYETDFCHSCEMDLDYLKNAHSHAKAKASAPTEAKKEDVNIPEELKDSAQKILDYSEVSSDKAEAFLANLNVFRKLKDKLSSENDVRSIRSAISSVFFEVYNGVYRKVRAQNDNTRIYQMFLDYGYMDEKLLSSDHIMTLYKLAGKQSAPAKVPVYHLTDWLDKIVAKEREPSINEFGQDYYDVFREAKKRSLTEKDLAELDSNVEGKIKFEIDNMIKNNQRICYGQMSSYFPILHDDMVTRDLNRAVVTVESINESIQRILDVDFSAFHREVSYRNVDIGLEKEFIMKAVMPDVILMPTFGSRATMWQEIAGRNRSAPGRFIFPAFTSENLDDMVLKVIGNFRWELCRTMMGISWNDISQKSLTSEYSDYIQFYRKNKDLSEEGKEKIKALTQKYRNMTREIFTSEYETWINFESKGNVRLNKVVRGIFYQHCPFARPIREYLEKQPMYAEIATKFRNLREKTAKGLENHYNKLIKSGIPLDEECQQNLKFYKDL